LAPPTRTSAAALAFTSYYFRNCFDAELRHMYFRSEIIQNLLSSLNSPLYNFFVDAHLLKVIERLIISEAGKKVDFTAGCDSKFAMSVKLMDACHI